MTVAWAVLAACRPGQPDTLVGVSTPRAAEESNSPKRLDAGAVKASPVAPDFRSHMERIVERQLSRGHAEQFDAIVWANEVARAAWEGGSEMPEGALFVEEAIEASREGDRAAGLWVMEKRGGIWRFTAVGPDREMADEAHVSACAACHKDAPRGDFVFPVQRINKAPSAAMTATAPTPVATAAATYDARSAGSAAAPSNR